jgi:hypothetical protein
VYACRTDNDTSFEAPDAHFDSDQKKLEIRENPLKAIEEPKKPECHKIEPNPSKDRAVHEGDNPSF